MASNRNFSSQVPFRTYYNISVPFLSCVNACRATEWLKILCRRVQRGKSWCLSVRERGAAPQRQSQQSVASAASGWSAWWDARASPRACSTASGRCLFRDLNALFTYNKSKLTVSLFFKHLVSQEQFCIWLLPEQRRDRLLWPNSGRKTFCHQIFWHLAVFSL